MIHMDSVVYKTEKLTSSVIGKDSVSKLNCSYKKRKFRGTNDFVPEILTDAQEDSCNFYKEKMQTSSFLPKIGEVKLTSCSLSNLFTLPTLERVKKQKVLKFYKQKLESKCITAETPNNGIARLKLRKAKGVWTPVTSCHSMNCELYIPLIPLEKTYLLTESQLKQLVYCKLDKEKNVNLSSFCRPCSVILTRLTLKEIDSKLNLNMQKSTVHYIEDFNPQLTSSPNVTHNVFLDDVQNRNVNHISVYSSSSSEQRYSSKHGTVIEISSTFDTAENSTYSGNTSTAKKETLKDLSLTDNENVDYLNCTYQITQTQDTKKTPKSVLKSNHPSPPNNNRRVTFNDTSIIIHDSGKLYTSSTPTHFAENVVGNGTKRRTSFYHVKKFAGKTPGNVVLRNTNKKEYSGLNLMGSKKRTCMPDFAQTHRRMFDGMLDIKQDADEKLKRSQLLLSGCKANRGAKKLSNNHIKIVNSNLKKHTKAAGVDVPVENSLLIKKKRFHFKEKIKNSDFHKEQVHGLSNTVHMNEINNKGNNKQYIKGIRSNRRFELLMKLRKKQDKK